MRNTDNITRENLSQFRGSEGLYYHPLFRGIDYTDGVKFLNNNGAGWLVDAILSHLTTNKMLQEEEFLAITLNVFWTKTGKNHAASLTITDGNEEHLVTQKISYTDFPLLGELKFFATNGVLMLASEY